MQDRFKFRCFGKQGFLKGLKKLFTFEETEQGYYNVKFEGGWINFVEKNDLKIMQCTGLKDRNGKLIYEGDIFKIGETDNEVVYKYVVWNKEKANFGIYTKFVWDDEPFYPNGNEIAEEIENFDEYFIGLFEVIGNIYENPELLESEKNNE